VGSLTAGLRSGKGNLVNTTTFNELQGTRSGTSQHNLHSPFRRQTLRRNLSQTLSSGHRCQGIQCQGRRTAEGQEALMVQGINMRALTEPS